MWSSKESSTPYRDERLRVKNPRSRDASADPCNSTLLRPDTVCQVRKSSIEDDRALRDVVKSIAGSTLKSPKTTTWCLSSRFR